MINAINDINAIGVNADVPWVFINYYNIPWKL